MALMRFISEERPMLVQRQGIQVGDVPLQTKL